MALVEGIQNKAWLTHMPIHVHSMKELHEMEGATPPGAGGPPEMAGGGMMELPELPDGPDGPGFPPVPKDLTAAGCPRGRDHYPDRKTRCHRAACLRRPVGVPSVKPHVAKNTAERFHSMKNSAVYCYASGRYSMESRSQPSFLR